MKDVMIYFLLFMIYSFCGWALEVLGKLIEKRRFINRGFLIGPYCPIYGFGALAITFLLKRYSNDAITLFIMAILVCGVLEYFTSYIMEKLFKARWWDYSQKRFNINGRVCLDTIIPFGLLGLFITYISNPFFLNILNKLSFTWLVILSSCLSVTFVVDNILSFNIISTVRTTTKGLYKELDNTEEITKKVKEILLSKSILHRRLIHAFPRLESIKARIKE
ncbi:MAG: putative ABC transporter permease, partial [Clostridia bacterium]|nr:putative ABC transporter permease [Clostridia bacterium]